MELATGNPENPGCSQPPHALKTLPVFFTLSSRFQGSRLIGVRTFSRTCEARFLRAICSSLAVDGSPLQ
eukprot:490353-Pyramimonas_sp.AAC.1